ncbi:MAG TPA: topoisomerase DNA-binding C4 zinc finger domain-containing protein [Sumerlaeia bacterium]|nr:topoisomerase DNA-binding C4 zinc finger domain-containing protein [Sumerlaeia bacterium]
MSVEIHKCMNCERPATTKITKIGKGGKVFDIYLCDEHAQTFSPYLKKTQPANLVELLQHLLKQQGAMAEAAAAAAGAEEELPGRTCANCGLNYGAYRKTLLLGCSDCYDSFEDLLSHDLRKMHGVIRHAPEEEGATLAETSVAADAESAAKVPLVETINKTETAAQVKTDAAVKSPDGALSVADLKRKLRQAIDREDFEQAARVRDSIRMLESLQPKEEVRCKACNAPMVVKHGPGGLFLGCSEYPKCRETRPLE